MTEEQQKIPAVFGFRAEELTAQTAKRLNLNPAAGKVIITAIDQASNAYFAGLRSGDIILSLNRQSLSSFADYNALVKNIKSGDLLFLLVERQGNKIYFAFNV